MKQYELLTRLDLKPGRYQLRVSTESKLRGKAGSVFADLEVPDFSKPFSMSGMVVHAEPALAAPSDTGMVPLAPLVPTTMRDFSSDQQVTTFLKIYQGGNGKPTDVPLSVRIRDVRDKVVFETSQNLNAARFDATGAAEYRLAVPVDKLAPGPYLLTIEGKLKKDTVRRDVRFEMHASTASEPTSADVPAQPGLDGVLARMAAYLAAYADQYASTIATEHYKQTDRSGTRDLELALEAEFGIFHLPGSRWLGFRDVTRVNGRPVADHEGAWQESFWIPQPMRSNRRTRSPKKARASTSDRSSGRLTTPPSSSRHSMRGINRASSSRRPARRPWKERACGRSVSPSKRALRSSRHSRAATNR